MISSALRLDGIEASLNSILSVAIITILLAASIGTRASASGEVRIAAAADLNFAMKELSAEFEKASGTKVKVTFGSSGNFFSQMQNGAPFDVFLSADIDYARKLETAGLAEPGAVFPYALGRIIVWLPPDSKIELEKLGWKSLLDSSIQKIAIANPQHAPYGRAAIAAMQKAGIYEQVKAKLVFGENISQAAQFVQSGNAQAGILALSLAMSPAMRNGKSWGIPAQQYPPILQGAVVLKNASNKVEAIRFLAFLKSEPARKILEKYGFSIPGYTPSTGKTE
jgi:molybdate transport system substrate-binding protein